VYPTQALDVLLGAEDSSADKFEERKHLDSKPGEYVSGKSDCELRLL
jgi:hypothetical protein